MLFWFVCLVLTLVVVALIVSPLLRPAPVKDTNPDVVLYRGQLAEIDRDVARAILEPEEAERARTEIARRLLAANKAKVTATAHGGPAPFATGFVVIVVLAVSFGAIIHLAPPVTVICHSRPAWPPAKKSAIPARTKPPWSLPHQHPNPLMRLPSI